MISDVPRHVAFFVYPGFLLLDLSGPLEAFSTANELVPGSYRFSYVSLGGGPVESSSGVRIATETGGAHGIDTFVVAGDPGLSEARVSPETVALIQQAALGARRTASVCMGAFMLAASGLLDGRRATTHWCWAARMKERYPAVLVEEDRIFVNDGTVWTSAGMTAGIDLALALIEQDLGRDTARAIARLMVVYYRRPGGQMQYSSLLDMDPPTDRVGQVLTFAREHLSEPLSVERLAELANLSVRQFSRAFAAATGMPPAKAIERLRAESARPLVEDGRETLEVIAPTVGFSDAEQMRRAFVRTFGQSPQAMRRAAGNSRNASTAFEGKSDLDPGPGALHPRQPMT